DDYAAAETDSAAHDRCDGSEGGHDAALVFVGAHSPHPAVLELGAVRIHAPATHLHAGIHVAVQHEARPAARSPEARDRLARRLAGLGPVGDLHHLDVEADVGHAVGEVIGDRALLEGRARSSDGCWLETTDRLDAVAPSV